MRRRRARPWAGVGWPALLFVAAPVLLFGLPAVFGTPWLVGDNLIQYFPLRVLVGTDLRHGHLPLWDPYLWSGSPLLAGFNAGAAYPFSWLFAVLPHALAWVSNQVVVEVVAAAGMLALLRGQGRSWPASGLGAGAFCYGGFMAVQSEHLDLVQAAGWLVWAFVALDRLGRRAEGRRAPWVALLGVALGLMLLTGAAEPVLDGAVALGLFGLWLLWRARGRRLALAVSSLSGVGLGLLIGAVQLLPGNSLEGRSQRAVHSYLYFASGSINKSFTLLGLEPLLFGSAHRWPVSYFATYNLPEVSSYIGILPVMAVFGLLARRHRRSAEAGQWWIWYAVGAVGLVLAWGSFTPLGHLEYLVPIYNRQRLLGRNLLEVDLAMAVLFAAWVDQMLLAARGAEPRRRRRWRWPSDVVLPLVPVVAVVGLQVVILAGGPWFPHFLHVPGQVSYGTLWRLGLFLTVPSALAVAAGWLVVRGPRLGRRVPVAAAVLLFADLAVFNVVGQTFPEAYAAASSKSTTANALAALVAADGVGPGGLPHRMALYDPDRLHPNEVDAIGQPDLTILRDLSSVQGYGAIVDARYDSATGTHEQGNLSVPALAGGTFSGLDLGVLVTVPESFVHLVVAPAAAPNAAVVGATALPPVPPDRAAPSTGLGGPPTPVPSPGQPPLTGPVSLAPGQARTWDFGTALAVRAVRLPLDARPAGVAAQQLRVGLLSADGSRTRWLPTTEVDAARRSVDVTVPGAPEASGIVVEQLPAGGGTLTIGPATVSTAGQGTYRLDGALRDVVTAPGWRFDGRIGVFGAFTADAASGRAWTLPAGRATARVVAAPAWGTDRIEVHASAPVTLVRDVGYATGWQAEVEPVSGRGPGRSVPVVRRGLVQAVAVPAGAHVVVFRYRPHRVVEGMVLSGLGVLVALGLVMSGRRAPGPRHRGAGARDAAARSARAPDGAAPGPAPSAPAGGAAGQPPRGP